MLAAISMRRLADNWKRLGPMATALALLSITGAVSESAQTRNSSLSVFPEEIKLPASGVHRLFVTSIAADAEERDVTGEASFKSNHRGIAEVSQVGVIR